MHHDEARDHIPTSSSRSALRCFDHILTTNLYRDDHPRSFLPQRPARAAPNSLLPHPFRPYRPDLPSIQAIQPRPKRNVAIFSMIRELYDEQRAASGNQAPSEQFVRDMESTSEFLRAGRLHSVSAGGP